MKKQKSLNTMFYTLFVTVAFLQVINAAQTDDYAERTFSSFTEDLISTLAEDEVVKKVIDAGMNAVKSAVVEEGVKVLKKNDNAKRYVKTGLDVMKAVDSLASLADDEQQEKLKCHFQCPQNERGFQGRPFRRLDHVPSSNGCGSYGLRFEDAAFPAVTNCCNIHDRCYDECGSVKDDCDRQFERCLEGVCSRKADSRASTSTYSSSSPSSSSSLDDCDLIKDGLVLAVISFGCNAYLDAQKNACVCV